VSKSLHLYHGIKITGTSVTESSDDLSRCVKRRVLSLCLNVSTQRLLSNRTDMTNCSRLRSIERKWWFYSDAMDENIDWEFVTSAKKFANFNEFSEMKKIRTNSYKNSLNARVLYIHFCAISVDLRRTADRAMTWSRQAVWLIPAACLSACISLCLSLSLGVSVWLRRAVYGRKATPTFAVAAELLATEFTSIRLDLVLWLRVRPSTSTARWRRAHNDLWRAGMFRVTSHV